MTDKELDSARADIESTTDLPDFKVLPALQALKEEIANALA